MEIAMGLHSLTTTTQTPNVNLPSSGQQVTARLSAWRSLSPGGTGPKTPWSGTLQEEEEYEGGGGRGGRRRKLHKVHSAKHKKKNEWDCLLSPATEIRISSFTISSSTQITKKFLLLHGTRVFITVATKGHS